MRYCQKNTIDILNLLLEAVINDYNPFWPLVYNQIKKDPQALIDTYNGFVEDGVLTAEAFYHVRGLDREPGFDELPDIVKAARFLFLINTVFNGLWRVNKKGQMNTPFNKTNEGKPLKQLDEKNLWEIHEYLNKANVTILTGDYHQVLDDIKAGDFVYLDPPYAIEADESNYVGYTAKGFDNTLQVELAEFCREIDKRGAYFMQSNSNAQIVKELYQGFHFNEVEINRLISSKAELRGKKTELVITNYKN